jgi:hypothetical protein
VLEFIGDCVIKESLRTITNDCSMDITYKKSRRKNRDWIIGCPRKFK